MIVRAPTYSPLLINVGSLVAKLPCRRGIKIDNYEVYNICFLFMKEGETLYNNRIA